MSNTIFIALQCCQCSIMQVKQKKKSSNKWTCVVCNQKQSVKKVFAQGYNAKDLRQFVQSFNMSLKDRPREEQEEEEEEEEEMPNKKAKLNFSGEGDVEAKSHQSRNKVDSKWRDYLTEEDEEPRTSQPTMTNAASSKWRDPRKESQQNRDEVDSKWRDYLTREDEELRTSQPTMTTKRNCQATMGKAASKWSGYLTEDDRDEQRVNTASKWQEEREFADHKGKLGNGVFKTTTNDQEVEDDIHPDFI